MREEGLYSSVINGYGLNIPIQPEHGFSQREKDRSFAMRCNGYFNLCDGTYRFIPDAVIPMLKEFKAQNVSFFGPGGGDLFYSDQNIGRESLFNSFSNPVVTNAIRKYRNIDEDQAARISFIFGGLVRHLRSEGPHSNIELTRKINRSVEFTAQMSMLGGQKSGDAITSAIAMYVISGGALEPDKNFTKQVYQMNEAICDDPVIPEQTEDLGLSQVYRLRSFWHKILNSRDDLPDVSEEKQDFEQFPTTGAEFHFPITAPFKNSGFWKKIALLNMAQYQRGSFIQLSRNDRDVIEIRMNPSIYPVTIANWKYMKFLLPQLRNTFFTSTINRQSNQDFNWTLSDANILERLRIVGMLSYAGIFNDIPRKEIDEINFGSVYLGQTVKMHSGRYSFTGNWAGGEGQFGQMGIYAGFGDNFPHLAYYSTMVLRNPNILSLHEWNNLDRIKTLEDAMSMHPEARKEIFRRLEFGIERDQALKNATIAGSKILEKLSP